MTRFRPKIMAAMATAAAAICACASSGGGISGTSLVIGPISGFGSIVVDDITFDTTNAVVTINARKSKHSA